MLYVTAAAAVALTVFTVALVPPSPPGRVAYPTLVAGLVAGIGVVISYAIVFTMRVPDFTVDVRGDRDVWLAGLTMLLPLLALTALGVWMYARAGLFHIADVLREVEVSCCCGRASTSGAGRRMRSWRGGVGSITALALRPVSPFAGLAAGSAVAAMWLWVVSRPASLGSESLDGVEQRR